MTEQTIRSLVERAETIDVLADNMKPLIDAAAKCGLEELFTINQILNRRGIKIGVLEEYGLLRRKRYEFEERARQRAAKKILKKEQAKITSVIREQLSKKLETVEQSHTEQMDELECLK